jgi:hypothetical protein
MSGTLRLQTSLLCRKTSFRAYSKNGEFGSAMGKIHKQEMGRKKTKKQ